MGGSFPGQMHVCPQLHGTKANASAVPPIFAGKPAHSCHILPYVFRCNGRLPSPLLALRRWVHPHKSILLWVHHRNSTTCGSLAWSAQTILLLLIGLISSLYAHFFRLVNSPCKFFIPPGTDTLPAALFPVLEFDKFRLTGLLHCNTGLLSL